MILRMGVFQRAIQPPDEQHQLDFGHPAEFLQDGFTVTFRLAIEVVNVDSAMQHRDLWPPNLPRPVPVRAENLFRRAAYVCCQKVDEAPSH